MPSRRVTASGSVLHLTDAAPAAQGTAISNARLAMVAFLAFETMFFAALVGSYLIFRLSSAAWPPPELPRLPLAITWANTAVLAASAWTMALALRALHRSDRAGLERNLSITAVLGTTFLAVQGSEWIRLVQHGLTLSSGTYGATFYTLIGCHGVHVLGAVLWLLVLMIATRRDRFRGRVRVPIEICAMYWFFVVGLWGALFPLVYML
jgi:heme/copper-type cytochrome/quinol oxidase subunit 3